MVGVSLLLKPVVMGGMTVVAHLEMTVFPQNLLVRIVAHAF